MRAGYLSAIIAGLCVVATASAQMTAKEYREAKKAEIKAIAEANKLAVVELNKLKSEMAALNMKGEVVDCEQILAKCLEPGKSGDSGGSSTPWPGEEVYFTKVLDRFAEVGDKLSAAYADVQTKIVKNEELAEKYEILSGWLASFSQIAERMKHFNKRRKECKMGPVTCSFGASYGGYMHGRYVAMNRNHPSTAGLGAHNESPKLPGYSPEGAAAAKGIGGGGWFDGWMGSMFHRKPVMNPTLARIRFGGKGGSWWCKAMGGSNKRTTDLLTFPGDGAEGISPVFSGEHPNPLPEGVRSCGTMIVIIYFKGKPKNFRYRLLDPEGTHIKDLIVFDDSRAHVFSARQHLGSGTYTVELLGDNYKSKFSFTTGGRFGTRRIVRNTPRTGPGAGSGSGAAPEMTEAEKAARKAAEEAARKAAEERKAEEEALAKAEAEKAKREAELKARIEAERKRKIEEAAKQGETEAEKAAFRALAQPQNSPGFKAEAKKFLTLWAKLPEREKRRMVYKLRLQKLGRLGVPNSVLMELYEKGEPKLTPEEAAAAAKKKAEHALGFNPGSTYRKKYAAEFMTLWNKLAVEPKLVLIKSLGQKKLVSLGCDKSELEELAEFGD